jgi:hypothetical protein
VFSRGDEVIEQSGDFRFWQILLQNRHIDGAGRPVHFF